MSGTQFHEVRLTQFSHGGGCGCKISPKVLDQILAGNWTTPDQSGLIVGNHARDDAAVYDLGTGQALISTTDFFMPIVDDPFDFGRIASANAISDIYAMGGTPILALGILGWPLAKLGAEVARRVIEGSRSLCSEAGISLAGGHSIDSPEPIFGLAVNGLGPIHHIKQNNTARPGDILFLTKKLGTGILTTAEKSGILLSAHEKLATNEMIQLNSIGTSLGELTQVHAMTDVTGFGLLGHLIEMAEGSGLSASIEFEDLPLLTAELRHYVASNSLPGGTGRNWESYGQKILFETKSDVVYQRSILADPQTSGGLLVAVDPDGVAQVTALLQSRNLYSKPIGYFLDRRPWVVQVKG